MSVIPSFHDGFFDGVWIAGEKRVEIFLRTAEKRRYVMVLYGVEALHISNVREGNIVLNLEFVGADQLTEADMEELYELSEVEKDEQIARLLVSARQSQLTLLQMSSSFGAECVALIEKAELRDMPTSGPSFVVPN